MEAKVDIRKLQLLNDRIHQTIDALNQVRMSVQGIQHSAPQYPSASGSFSPNAAQQLAQQQVQLLVQLALANPAAASQAIAQNPYLQQMLAQTPWAQQALASTGFGNGSFGFGAGIAHSNGSHSLLCTNSRFVPRKREPAQDTHAKGICPLLVSESNAEGLAACSLGGEASARRAHDFSSWS